MSHGTKFKQRELLLAALMSQPTIAQAAQQAGVAKSTALRWLAEPGFRRQFDAAKRQALGETLAYLQRSMLGAVARLNALLMDPQSKPIIQLGAARALLEYGLRAYELEEVTGRLLRLEEALAIRKGLDYADTGD